RERERERESMAVEEMWGEGGEDETRERESERERERERDKVSHEYIYIYLSPLSAIKTQWPLQHLNKFDVLAAKLNLIILYTWAYYILFNSIGARPLYSVQAESVLNQRTQQGALTGALSVLHLG